MKKLIALLLLTLTYGTRIEVIGGFYKGCRGYVSGYNSNNEYYVSLHCKITDPYYSDNSDKEIGERSINQKYLKVYQKEE